MAVAVGLLLAAGLSVAAVLYARLRGSRQALAAATRAKDRLYAVVAHDLRGPVQSLGGLGGLIEHFVDRRDETSLRSLPPLVTQAVDRVNGLLDNLLHWAATESGAFSARPEALPVADLLAEAADLWRTTAQSRELTLTVAPVPTDAPPLRVQADRQLTRTILRNLVGNALKFTPGGGTVTLGATPVRDAAGPPAVALWVQDTGPGLTETQVRTLLADDTAPADRPRTSGVRGEEGTGLGLRLATTLARRQGGALQLSATPGRGVRATLQLPATS